MMVHRCKIDGSSAACFENEGELWVKEYSDGNHPEGRTYAVKFCPQCGFKIPEKRFTKSFASSINIPGAEADNRISDFSYELGKAISEMNHNIAIIKSFMSSQITQNQCFIDSEMEIRKRVSKLEKIGE